MFEYSLKYLSAFELMFEFEYSLVFVFDYLLGFEFELKCLYLLVFEY